MEKITTAKWTELYEALLALYGGSRAQGLNTRCLEGQIVYMLEHCPIPQPKQMPVL